MYRGARSGELWIAVTLILIGLVFLVQNYAGVVIGNWWALFILIPAFAILGAAWTAWQSGSQRAAVSGPFTGGLIMLSVAAIILFDFQWAKVWPVFLIVIGIAVLVSSLVDRTDRSRRDAEVVSRA